MRDKALHNLCVDLRQGESPQLWKNVSTQIRFRHSHRSGFQVHGHITSPLFDKHRESDSNPWFYLGCFVHGIEKRLELLPRCTF
jgi:hypothetical protein